MINQNKVEAALEYMRNNASALATAKANRVQLTHMLKVMYSRLYQSAEGKTVEDRKAWALGHDEYVKSINGLSAAVEEEEFHHWKMEAAINLVKVWQTQEASNRAIDRSHQ